MSDAGYAIWREVIAEVMAQRCQPDMTRRVLGTPGMQEEIDFYREHMMPQMPPEGNPAEKYYLSEMIDVIMSTEDVRNRKSWAELEEKLVEHNALYLDVVKVVYDHLLEEPIYEITPDLMEKIGNLFVAQKVDWLIELGYRVNQDA